MDNNSAKPKSLKKKFHAGVFAAFLAFMMSKIFDPIFEYVYSIFLSFGGSIIQYVSNSTYREISNGFSDQTSLLLLYLVYLICFSYLVSLFTSLKSLFRRYRNTFPAASQDKDTTSSKENFDNMSIEEIKEFILETSKKMDRINQAEKRRKLFDTIQYIFAECSIVFLIIVLLFLYSRNVYIAKKVTVLTNNIEIVSPYISDMEYKQLKSDFHSIQTKKDYEDLTNSLAEVAEINCIDLKE